VRHVAGFDHHHRQQDRCRADRRRRRRRFGHDFRRADRLRPQAAPPPAGGRARQDAARQAGGVQGLPPARAQARIPGRGRTAHRQVDGRALRGHGQAVEHLARFARRMGAVLAPQARRGLRARLLQRPGRELPRRGARQHPARRQHAGEAGLAEAGIRQDFRTRHAHGGQLHAAHRWRGRVPAVVGRMGAFAWAGAAVLPARRAGRGGGFRARRRPADGAATCATLRSRQWISCTAKAC